MAISAFSTANFNKYAKPTVTVGQFLFFINEDYEEILLIDSTGRKLFIGSIGELTNSDNKLYKKYLDRIVKEITIDNDYHYCIFLE